MYAVIKTGGKQYQVAQGDVLKVESLPVEEGSGVTFEHVLLVADGEQIHIGQPMLTGAKVTGTVLRHGRGKKINIIKFKRRKGYLKRQGHRQNFTEIKITGIEQAA